MPRTTTIWRKDTIYYVIAHPFIGTQQNTLLRCSPTNAASNVARLARLGRARHALIGGRAVPVAADRHAAADKGLRVLLQRLPVVVRLVEDLGVPAACGGKRGYP